MVMGHSLGEWAAAVGAGMVTFAEALVAVMRVRGRWPLGCRSATRQMASVMGPPTRSCAFCPRSAATSRRTNNQQPQQTSESRGQRCRLDRAVDYSTSWA